MKKNWKALLILVLLLGILGGKQAEAWSAFSADGTQEITLSAAENGAAGLFREEGRVLAKSSRKKKNRNTPTPSPRTEKTTAAPEETATSAKTAAPSAGPSATPVPDGPITDPQSIADYLFSHEMQLPDNFITKKEARALGWDSSRNYVSDVAPGKSIGGDYFGNYEGKLPVGKGITYREADCYYTRGKRNAYRILYSSEGRVWYTADHYNSFEELFPSSP